MAEWGKISWQLHFTTNLHWKTANEGIENRTGLDSNVWTHNQWWGWWSHLSLGVCSALKGGVWGVSDDGIDCVWSECAHGKIPLPTDDFLTLTMPGNNVTIERTCPPDAPLWAVRFPSSINFTYAFKLFSDRGGFQRYREMKVLLTVTLNVLYFRRSHQSLVITTLVFTPQWRCGRSYRRKTPYKLPLVWVYQNSIEEVNSVGREWKRLTI